MARQISIPASFPPVQLLAPTTTNGGATSRRVSVKGRAKVTIIVDLKQAAAHATVISLMQATAVTGGSTAAGPSVPNWLNEDCAASDVRVKGTDAASVTVASAIKSKQVIFEVDPARLTDGYAYVYVTASDSSQATNFMNAQAILQESYQQASPPTAVA